MNVRTVCISLLVAFAQVAGQEPVTEHVAKMDLLAAMAPEGIIQVREVHSQGTLLVCATDRAIQARMQRRQSTTDPHCARLPIERVDREGSFPYVDATIGTATYPANEAHLIRHGGSWFVFLEGGHDESVIRQHSGTVLLVSPSSGTDPPFLALTCFDQIEAYDTDESYLCIANDLPPRDIELIAWSGRRSCSVDYSICT